MWSRVVRITRASNGRQQSNEGSSQSSAADEPEWERAEGEPKKNRESREITSINPARDHPAPMVRHMAHKQYWAEIPFKWKLTSQTRRGELSRGRAWAEYSPGASHGSIIPSSDIMLRPLTDVSITSTPWHLGTCLWHYNEQLRDPDPSHQQRPETSSHGAAWGAKTRLMTDGLSFVVTLFLWLVPDT